MDFKWLERKMEFDDYLNQKYSKVTVCTTQFYLAEVLYELDYDLYLEMYKEWEENIREEANDD